MGEEKPLVPVRRFTDQVSRGSFAPNRASSISETASSIDSSGSKRRSISMRHLLGTALVFTPPLMIPMFIVEQSAPRRRLARTGDNLLSNWLISRTIRLMALSPFWGSPAWALFPVAVTSTQMTPRSSNIAWSCVCAPQINTSGFMIPSSRK